MVDGWEVGYFGLWEQEENPSPLPLFNVASLPNSGLPLFSSPIVYTYSLCGMSSSLSHMFK